jgi:hypothetical protein
MERFRVLLDGVDDPDDPLLIARLAKLSRRDALAVRNLLDQLPGLLTEGVDRDAAQRLQSYLKGVGARVSVHEIAPANAPVAHPPPQPPAALNVIRRLRWGLEIFAHTWGRQLVLILMLLGILIGAGVMWLVLSGVGADLAVSPDDPTEALKKLGSPGAVAGLVAVQTVVILAGFWYQASLIRLAAAFMENGERLGLGSVMGVSWLRTPELTTAFGLLMLPVVVVLAAGTFAALAFAGSQNLPLVATVIGAASVVTVFLVVAFALLGPVAVLENIGPWGALQRAWVLGRGRRWRILGNLLVFAFLFAAASLSIEFLISWTVALGSAIGALGVAVVLALTILLVAVLYLVAAFLIQFLLTAFYFEARVRSEFWAPHWEAVPDPSWPVSEGSDPSPRGRGMRAWIELGAYALLAIVVSIAGLALMAEQVADLVAPLSVPHERAESGRMG